MIEEAKYWQNDLKNTATKLERRYRQKHWTIKSSHSVEKEIFLSFFIIRKLIESKRLSTHLVAKKIKLTRYPRKGTGSIPTTPKMFHEQYNLTKGDACQISLKDLSSQFVHSYIFSPFVPAGIGLVGVFFCSDRDKEHSLYHITLANIVEVILSIGAGVLKSVKLAIEPNSNIIRTVIQ